MTLVFLIGWQFLYCSFSIYLRYHPDGLGGSVNHTHFSNHIQSCPLGPLNSTEASQPRALDCPRTLRAAEHNYKQVKLFICYIVLSVLISGIYENKALKAVNTSCVYETKKVSHRWNNYKAWYLQSKSLHFYMTKQQKLRLFGSIKGLLLKQDCSVSPIYAMVGSK